MIKKISVIILCFVAFKAQAQVEVARLIGKNSADYSLGFGAFLKIGYPVSEASDISIEGNLLFFFANKSSGDGLAVVPFKLGYRYTVNGSGTGVYIEPQAGYNFFGANSYKGEHPFKGPVLAIGTGYLFERSGNIQFDLGLRYESIFFSGGPASFIALRLSHNFSFRRRDSDY